jgi:very-short-patch-repair endonuclease
MEYKNNMQWRKLKLSLHEKEEYYTTVIKPLIWQGLTSKQMQDQKLILCSHPTARDFLNKFGSTEDKSKYKENTRAGKAHGKTKGRPNKYKGMKYEEWMAPEKVISKKAQASKFWKENNPRKYFTGNNVSKGQRLLYEMIKEKFPSAILEYEIPAPGKKYYLDIAVPEHKLNFEYDGIYWHSFPEAIERDKIRDEYLKSLGWKVFRYSFNARNDLEVREELIKLNINFKDYE